MYISKYKILFKLSVIRMIKTYEKVLLYNIKGIENSSRDIISKFLTYHKITYIRRIKSVMREKFVNPSKIKSRHYLL